MQEDTHACVYVNAQTHTCRCQYISIILQINKICKNWSVSVDVTGLLVKINVSLPSVTDELYSLSRKNISLLFSSQHFVANVDVSLPSLSDQLKSLPRKKVCGSLIEILTSKVVNFIFFKFRFYGKRSGMWHLNWYANLS